MNVQTVSGVASQKSTRAAVKTDVLLLAGWIALTALSRLLFASHTLYHFDSVNFALALENFDVRIDQPQVPGYLLYVALGQAANAVLRDPNATFVLLSIAGSALASGAMWRLGRAMFGPAAGWVAALLLSTSPLYWFYGEIALPHALDLLFAAVSAWQLWEIRQGDADRLPWAALMLGIAGGLRPQTLVFLGPLILFSVWRTPIKKWAGAAIVLAAVCLAWLIPLLTLTGGLSAYLALFSSFSSAYQDSTSVFSGAGWQGLSRNLIKLVQYTAYAWGAGLLPAGLWLLMRMVRRPTREDGQSLAHRTRMQRLRSLFDAKHERAWFLMLWIAPALGYYALVHMGQQGLVFVFLPALLLISAEAMARIGRGLNGDRVGIGLAGLLVALNAFVFVFMPEFPLGSESIKLLTRATIDRQDRDMQARIAAIRSTYTAGETLIIAAQWRHAEYYLREYRVVRFGIVNRWEREGGLPVARPDGETVYRLSDRGLSARGATVVLFDPELATFAGETAAEPAAAGLHTLNWSPNQVFWLNEDGFGLRN